MPTVKAVFGRQSPKISASVSREDGNFFSLRFLELIYIRFKGLGNSGKTIGVSVVDTFPLFLKDLGTIGIRGLFTCRCLLCRGLLFLRLFLLGHFPSAVKNLLDALLSHYFFEGFFIGLRIF